MISRRTRSALLLACALSAAACGDEGTGSRGTPTLSVVSGGQNTAPINTQLPEPLVLEVRDGNGAPAVGVTVLLNVIPDRTRPIENTFSMIYVGPGGPHLWRDEGTLRTGADGRVSTHILFAQVAGAPRLRVRAPELGVDDTLAYTVTPGPGFAFFPSVWDTTLYVGQSFTLHVDSARDEFRNPVTPEYTVSPSLGAQGAVVTALSVGRHPITLRSGTGTSTVWVNVVPHGAIAVQHGGYEPPDSPSPFLRMELVELDGSNPQPLADGQSGVAAWSPDGETLLFHTEYPPETFLARVGQVGASRVAPALTRAWEPAWSPDGAWIYLSGTDADDGRSLQIWKLRPDGSGLQRVTPVRDLLFDRAPQLSPDGTRLLFRRIDEFGQGGFRMLDLATGAETAFPVDGTMARWAPDGQTIAMGQDEGFIKLVTPSGSVLRTIGGGLSWYDWTGDGEYMVVGNGRTGDRESDLGLLVVQSDTLIRLAWSRRSQQRWVGPAWRP